MHTHRGLGTALASLAALLTLATAAPAGAGVHTEGRQALLAHLRVCLQLESELFLAFQATNVDRIAARARLSTSVECIRELLQDLDAASPVAVGVSDAHYAAARKQLATILELEEKDLARLDAAIAGKRVKTPVRGLIKSIERKGTASTSLRDLEDKRGAQPLVPEDFAVPDDVVDDPSPAPPPVRFLPINALRWTPAGVGTKPEATAGWSVQRTGSGKSTIKKVPLPDGTKAPTFFFQGRSTDVLGSTSFTADDVLTPPVALQGTGGLYSTKEKDRIAADGARWCLTLDREPQVDPPEFYGVCTNQILSPPGTQVFDFTHAGAAGGNAFFPNVTLVSMQILFDGDFHTEVQPRGDAAARVVLQDSFSPPGSWTAARAGFGAARLGKGAALGVEQVWAWSAPDPHFLLTSATQLLGAPEAGAAVLAPLAAWTRIDDVTGRSADGLFVEVTVGGTTGWIPRDAGLALNTQGLAVAN